MGILPCIHFSIPTFFSWSSWWQTAAICAPAKFYSSSSFALHAYRTNGWTFLWYVGLETLSLYPERSDYILLSLRWIPLLMATIMSLACFLRRLSCLDDFAFQQQPVLWSSLFSYGSSGLTAWAQPLLGTLIWMACVVACRIISCLCRLQNSF